MRIHRGRVLGTSLILLAAAILLLWWRSAGPAPDHTPLPEPRPGPEPTPVEALPAPRSVHVRDMATGEAVPGLALLAGGEPHLTDPDGVARIPAEVQGPISVAGGESWRLAPGVVRSGGCARSDDVLWVYRFMSVEGTVTAASSLVESGPDSFRLVASTAHPVPGTEPSFEYASLMALGRRPPGS